MKKVIENKTFRQLGKNTQVLLKFLREGKKGKFVVLHTGEGDFLSPKAVEKALAAQKEEFREMVKKLNRYQVAEVSREAYEKCKSDILEALK